MFTSESTRPIQFISAVLKRTPWVPSFSSSAEVGAPMPIDRPSFAAMLYMCASARKLPAPGMFFGTIDGLPGMCLPRWRATSRA